MYSSFTSVMEMRRIVFFLCAFLIGQGLSHNGRTEAVTREGGRLERSASADPGDCCGLPGRDGRDGRDGIQGPYGPPGAPGERGPPGAQSVINLDNQLEKIYEALVERLAAANISGGAVYTRWGRNVCPDHSEKLYSGIMAGSLFTHTGTGANQLCLPLDPQFNKTYPGYQSKSFLYGTEFEMAFGNNVLRTTNSGGVVPHNREAQCAVCYTPGRLTHLMIPARLECPSGWTVEYLGFLMSQHHTHQKSEYVCVDQDPDTHPATDPNLDGNLLYVVEAACGSLPCPQYVDGYEITCVVCTK